MFKVFVSDLKNSFRDLFPIVLVVGIFQAFFVGKMPENVISIVLGLVIVAIGLAIFIRGLELGIFPVGENLATSFAKKGSLVWLLLFAFLIGFSTTIAEPALIAVAKKAAIISSGKIDAFILRISVALSVGFAIALGVFRILVGHPIQYYIITGYILVVIITFFAPSEIVGLAYDSGGVTTSTVTVPLVAALGIGLSASIKGRNPAIDGFGLIAFASLTPMIFVQLYGIIVYRFADERMGALVSEAVKLGAEKSFEVQALFLELVSVIKDVMPIILVIAFFQYVIIKTPIPKLKRALAGVILVILGLYAFITGLELGLFPIGESIAKQLTAMDSVMTIYIFAFCIGFSTTMAEPALIAIAIKAEEVSQNAIKSNILRIAVALGVAVGIALGSYRIVVGDSIQYYVMVGYIIVIIQTYFSPKYIVPIAYDSGGVTTSTVTVPLVAALGLGLAENIPGRSPLVDGFGLIAFASLFPMITVMGYGILAQFLNKKETKDEV